MRSRLKGFYWRQMPQDHYQYRFFASTTPSHIIWTTPLSPGLVVKKSQEIASCRIDDKDYYLRMPFSGRVCKLSEPVQTQNQQIFLLEKCEHVPIQGSDKIQACQVCGDQLLSYEDKEQIAFTKKNFKALTNFDTEIDWNVALNQQFSPGQVLGLSGQDEICLDFTGRVVYFSNSKDRDEIILRVRKTICLHQKVKDNICLTCHAYVSITRKSITVQSNGVVSSGRLLQRLESQFAKKLKQDKKLILILDLDNTIVHCMQNFAGDEIMFELDDCLVVHTACIRYLIKLRPFMRQFLKKVIPRFDIYIYTKGTREYAQNICKHFRQKFADLLTQPQCEDFFTPKRIISRNQDSSLTKKSLHNILVGYQEIILIMDDRKDVWEECRRNVVNTRYYQHYQRVYNRISIRPLNDCYLYYTSAFLVSIHSKYFQHEKEKQDVRNILKTIQKQRLSNVKAYFLQQKLHTYSFYIRAINMGVVDVGDWRKTKPTLLIFSPTFNHPDKAALLQIGVPLVHELWLQYCYLLNFRFDSQMFEVTTGDNISTHTPEERAAFQQKLFQAHQLQ